MPAPLARARSSALQGYGTGDGTDSAACGEKGTYRSMLGPRTARGPAPSTYLSMCLAATSASAQTGVCRVVWRPSRVTLTWPLKPGFLFAPWFTFLTKDSCLPFLSQIGMASRTSRRTGPAFVVCRCCAWRASRNAQSSRAALCAGGESGRNSFEGPLESSVRLGGQGRRVHNGRVVPEWDATTHPDPG